MDKLIVVGGGGFAKEIIWLAKDCNFDVVGVLDDSPDMEGQTVLGVPVLGTISSWCQHRNCKFVIAIGSPRTRILVAKKMLTVGNPTFATLIHPSVINSKHVSIGEGTMVCAGSILTVDVEIGQHCILNLNVTVGHETTFLDFVTVAPMAAVSGNVILETGVEVGTGASIKQGLTLSSGAMLGMGGVLTKNIAPNLIFAGNPAKKLKEMPEL
ncbi:acetyltransferase [Photobacterium sp.]|uniref:acetyltransferase n=1 Tax=Photobacterium sp. TaxID=660 RepID=UPI00299E632A|nr:acetyltransferase [Photobacterium sp.]MDX1303660.1 acetyltransferase [Photobacterium sp.]